MADLGAIAYSIPLNDGSPVGDVSYVDSIVVSNTRVFSGTVKENAVEVSRRVRIYNRLTGELLRSGWSETSGTFREEISHPGEGEEYYIVAIDDETDGTDYNADIYDMVKGD